MEYGRRGLQIAFGLAFARPPELNSKKLMSHAKMPKAGKCPHQREQAYLHGTCTVECAGVSWEREIAKRPLRVGERRGSEGKLGRIKDEPSKETGRSPTGGSNSEGHRLIN